MREQSEKHVFQAEVNRMMKLIINSLYRNKEVSCMVDNTEILVCRPTLLWEKILLLFRNLNYIVEYQFKLEDGETQWLL